MKRIVYNIFGVLALFVLLLFSDSCAAGENGSEKGNVELLPGRVALVDVVTHDSAKAAIPAIVDQMLRQAFDSIPGITYVTFDERDAEFSEVDTTTTVADLADRLNLDGVLSLRIARFGSVVGIDLRLHEPATNKLLFHTRAFSFVRYRDEENSLLLGPALYEALNRLVNRLARQPDSEEFTVSAAPLVITSLMISRDPGLGKIADDRVQISKDGVRALGDFARFKFPELVIFDYESRSRLYETVGLAAVEDHAAVGNLERRALFNLDIPYYLVAAINPVSGDSVGFSVELRSVVSPEADTLVDAEHRSIEQKLFESGTTAKDAIGLLLEVAEEVLSRHVRRLATEYALTIEEVNDRKAD